MIKSVPQIFSFKHLSSSALKLMKRQKLVRQNFAEKN